MSPAFIMHFALISVLSFAFGMHLGLGLLIGRFLLPFVLG